MKKILTILAGSIFLAAFLFTSCQSTKQRATAGGTTGVQMANPFVTCSTLEEAAQTAGFSMTLPEKAPDWAIRTDYRASNVRINLLEIIYPGDEEYSREIRIRKGITDKEDISGDYNSYEKEETMKIAGKKCLARMNGEKIYLVTWKEDKYDYSLHISDGGTAENFANLMKDIK